VVDESYRQRLDGFIVKQIEEGGQVYIVCPAVDDGEETVDLELNDFDAEGNPQRRAPLRSTVSLFEEMSNKFPSFNIEILHGKMKAKDKEAVMKRFVSGETQILISTTVIEVGVNVPTACLMIVENAERFGLSQLHQLRGRVGRGNKKSYCVLVSESVGTESTAAQRLGVMKSCYDGYAIAEKDLELRGPGDFLRSSTDSSIRQSGGVRFNLATLCDDTSVLKQAFADAALIVDSDPELREYPLLKESVSKMFALDTGTIN
jgi:ATP-dependent DNA helicase RecG